MLSYGMLVLMTTALVGIQTCQGTEGGHCPRNDCSLQATANRSHIDCWIKEQICGEFPLISSPYPQKPENLQVNVYRTANNFEFNITWQPGSSERIRYLRGYQIIIEEKLHSRNTACFKMIFNTTLQKLDPEMDGQLMLHSDCVSGFTEGIQKDNEYMIKVQSLPVPERSGVETYISDDSVFIGYCDKFPVPNNTVDLQLEDIYLNNEVVELKCKPEHKLIGASALKCVSATGNGKWNDSIPECIEYQLKVTKFNQSSVLVNFTFLPDCPVGHTVRLRDLTHKQQLPKYAFYNVHEKTKVYENVPVGSWEACVNMCSMDSTNDVDYCIKFIIAEPETTGTTTTTTENNEEPTKTSSTLVYTSKQSTDVKNSSKNRTITYVFIIVLGCLAGLALIVLVWRCKRSSYKRNAFHKDLREELKSNESSIEYSAVGNNNMCMTPDLPYDLTSQDAVTICSQSRTGVDTGITPSGSV